MSLPTFATVSSCLGDDALVLGKMIAREGLGELFEYELELLSLDPEIALADVVSEPMTVHLEVAQDNIRHFNGVVSSFGEIGHAGRRTIYKAVLRPWLWLLTRSSDCRIFQDKTIPDVVKEVFRSHGFSDFNQSLSRSYRSWDYIVQYRESAFSFVSRLLEQEGIYYFFKHDADVHTLILADSFGAHDPAPGYDEIPYYPPQSGERRERDHLDGWRVSHEIQPGAYMLNDFDFRRPKAGLRARLTAPDNKGQFELYDYPGEYSEVSDGETYTRSRIEELSSQYETVEAQGNTRGLGAGVLFKLSGYPRQDQNRQYLVRRASLQLDVGGYESGAEPSMEPTVRCTLALGDSQIPFRPARSTRKPFISGPQTAIVVGPAGDEIHTDKFGRVKVQFHWDREGVKNETSSCWVRVAQIWAGTRWGGMHIPRIGQEVIVEFLEGDPDRPIITGRVYNADNMPPYDLPANKTQSGIKSRSTKSGNPDNFNELRFEDKKGAEQLSIQAEKNMDTLVKADQSLTVGGNRKKAIAGDETTTVGRNRTETVTANETITIQGNRNETVVGSETIDVTGVRTEHVAAAEVVSIDLGRVVTIGIGDMLNVGAARAVTVGGAHALTVALADVISVGGLRRVSVGGGQTTKIVGAHAVSAGGGQTVDITGAQTCKVSGDRSKAVGGSDSTKASKSIVIDAGDQITIKTGEASITLKKNGDIVLKGKNISLTGSGKINAKASGNVTLKGSNIGEN